MRERLPDYPPEYDLPDGPTNEDMLETLDAYGHLEFTVGNEDWIACADFNVFLRPDDDQPVVAYHVVVDCESGGFTDTLEDGILDASEIGSDWFPLWSYLDICAEHYIDEPDMHPSYDEAVKTAKRWVEDLQKHLKQAKELLESGDEIPADCMIS